MAERSGEHLGVSIAAADLPVGRSAYVARSGPICQSWPAMPSDTIGSRLRHYRRSKRWSQARLAEESGVSRQTIAEMERDAVQIPREPANVRALARALGVTMRELAEPTGWYDEGPAEEDWLAGLRADERLNDDERGLIERLVKRAYEAAERRAGTDVPETETESGRQKAI